MSSENLVLFEEYATPEVVDDPVDIIVPDNTIEVVNRKILTPHPYQDKAVRSVLEVFSKGINSTLLVSATGTGKMFMGALVAEACAKVGMKTLWSAHREELTTDAVETMREQGLRVGLEKAGHRARGAFDLGMLDVVVTTPQTYQGKRREMWGKDDFSLHIIDEAQHGVANQYLSIIDYHKSAKLLGMTATPYRLDGINLGNVFETKAFEYNIIEAIDDGYLVPVVSRTLEMEPPIDMRKLNARAGDFDSNELEEIIQDNLGGICNAIRQTRYDGRGLGDRYAIFFTPNVGSAESLAAALRSIGITAEFVSCYCKNRTEKVQNFKRGAYQVLVNAMILTEGADFPFVSCIGLLRPTKSTSLISQMIGRGTRLPRGHALAGDKKDCLVLEFSTILGEHNIARTVDIFNDGSIDKDVIARANEIVNTGEEDLKKAVEKAMDEFGKKQAHEEEKMRLAIREREVKFRSMMNDPFAMAERMGIRKIDRDKEVKPSPKWLIDNLNRLKVPQPEKLGYEGGLAARDYLTRRMKKGLATHRQVAYLENLGIPKAKAKRMSIKAAKEAIDKIKNDRSVP